MNEQLPAKDDPKLPAAEAQNDGARQHDDRLHRRNAILQGVLALVILIAAGLLGRFLYSQKTAPGETDQRRDAEPVEVVLVQPADRSVTVEGYGAVQARETLSLSPRVSGRVEWIHPNLVDGGVIGAGETALRLEQTDFLLDVREFEASIDQAEAQLDQLDSAERTAQARLAGAESTLKRVEAEAKVAVAEFKRLYPEREPPPLVAREPQLREARAAVEAAEAELADIANQRAALDAQIQQQRIRLERAEVDLSRASIALPGENGTYRVRSEDVSVGDRVSLNQVLATLYRVDVLEVPVPLSMEDLRWVRFPERHAGGEGTDGANYRSEESDPGSSEAVLSRVARGAIERWSGRVVRTEGEIDPTTRLATVVIRVSDPGELNDPQSTLLPGQFVQARIDGRSVSGVYRIPREALRGEDENRVWVAVPPDRNRGQSESQQTDAGDSRSANDNDSERSKGQDRPHTLVIRTVEIVHTGDEYAFVRGLESGDAVVLTRLDVVSEQMSVIITDVRGDAQSDDERMREEYRRLQRELEQVRQQLGDEPADSGDRRE